MFYRDTGHAREGLFGKRGQVIFRVHVSSAPVCPFTSTVWLISSPPPVTSAKQDNPTHMSWSRAPWPEQEELLSSYSAQVGISGRGASAGAPAGVGVPARRSLQQSPSCHLSRDSSLSVWGQPEPPASRGSSMGSLSAVSAPRMPRVSHPLRVEPPAEYNAPRRTTIGKPAGRPKSSQQKDYAVPSPFLSTLASPLAQHTLAHITIYSQVLASACRRAGKPANAAQARPRLALQCGLQRTSRHPQRR